MLAFKHKKKLPPPLATPAILFCPPAHWRTTRGLRSRTAWPPPWWRQCWGFSCPRWSATACQRPWRARPDLLATVYAFDNRIKIISRPKLNLDKYLLQGTTWRKDSNLKEKLKQSKTQLASIRKREIYISGRDKAPLLSSHLSPLLGKTDTHVYHLTLPPNSEFSLTAQVQPTTLREVRWTEGRVRSEKRGRS